MEIKGLKFIKVNELANIIGVSKYKMYSFVNGNKSALDKGEKELLSKELDSIFKDVRKEVR